jgi:hypothetical protein
LAVVLLWFFVFYTRFMYLSSALHSVTNLHMSLTSLPNYLLPSHIVIHLPLEDQWRLRRASKKIEVILDDWHFGKGAAEIMLRAMVETGVLLGFQAPITPVLGELTNVVMVRVMFNQTDPLHRWFKHNRVGMDAGGYYTRISDTERVRIGLWETGVDFVPQLQVFRRRGVRFSRTVYNAVVRDGYVIYNPNAAV